MDRARARVHRGIRPPDTYRAANLGLRKNGDPGRLRKARRVPGVTESALSDAPRRLHDLPCVSPAASITAAMFRPEVPLTRS